MKYIYFINHFNCRKFYTDAVPMIGTTAAVEQIAQLILNNEITGRMAEIWLSSLSLIQNPSTEMLEQIAVGFINIKYVGRPRFMSLFKVFI